ncbi:MAG TPA: CbrC family protein [Phycisphaerales bacterium]|nr:CbrC family protein [Phycisphaerales bacterium]
MYDLPTFPLFPDPVRERVFTKTANACGICNQDRAVLYAGPVYGKRPTRDRLVCPWCIADGSAAATGLFFNDSSTQSIGPGTARMTAADAALVEQRTPGFTTWQDNHWCACCDRACIYLGEADAEDLKGRWSQAVPSLFADCNWPPERVAETVERFERGGSPAAYIFKCQVCSKLQGYWDCD